MRISLGSLERLLEQSLSSEERDAWLTRAPGAKEVERAAGTEAEKREYRERVLMGTLKGISRLDDKELLRKSRELFRGVPVVAPEQQLYLTVFSHPDTFKEAKEKAKEGEKAYGEWILKISDEVLSDVKLDAYLGLGAMTLAALLDILTLKAGWLTKRFWVTLVSSYGAGEVVDASDVVNRLSQWNKEDLRSFGAAIFPLLLIPEINSTLKLRSQVNKFVPGILEVYEFDAPTVFSSGEYHKVTDPYELYVSMAGLGTKEKRIKQVIKRRKKDLVKLYEEFSDYIAKREGPRVAEKKGGSIYYYDLIDWLADDGMTEEANILKGALLAKKQGRYSPGEDPAEQRLDASELYEAIEGMGTDEAALKAVFSRRKNDLIDLYDEFNEFVEAKEGDYKQEKPDYYYDLIDWLIDDGEKGLADIVSNALKSKKKKRYSPGGHKSLGGDESKKISNILSKMSREDLKALTGK